MLAITAPCALSQLSEVTFPVWLVAGTLRKTENNLAVYLTDTQTTTLGNLKGGITL